MNLSTFKSHLQNLSELVFLKPDGSQVPSHFHLTEIGQIDKKFIDCGGVVRHEKAVSMQLWESVDFWHRLEPSKALHIVDLSETKLGIEDAEIEVEYQADTIGKYGLDFADGKFLLTSKNTTCLASDSCGVPVEKVKVKLGELKQKAQSCCTPGGGCC